jgi:hypothetical protein
VSQEFRFSLTNQPTPAERRTTRDTVKTASNDRSGQRHEVVQERTR